MDKALLAAAARVLPPESAFIARPKATPSLPALGKSRLVYLIVQDKKIRYATARSRVAYIGTTKMGAARIAHSAAYRAQRILGQRGVERLEARIITCQPRRHMKTWLKLERALPLTFRDMYGEPPIPMKDG